MVKLTVEIIERSCGFQNTIQDRELDLRDNKLQAIENLGITQNQYDAIDFSNNDIKKFENFPLLPRLKTVLLSNNRVSKIDTNMSPFIPNLQCVNLSNNQLAELSDLEGLFEFKRLRVLSLMENPVCLHPHYRLYLIHRMPQLRYLDFSKVRLEEKQEADLLFSGEKGQALRQQLAGQKKTKTFEVGQIEPISSRAAKKGTGLTPAEVEKIKEAIRKATSLDEITRLERLLRSGRLPGK